MIKNGNILTAADGMTLTNGDTFGKIIYLGLADHEKNWMEIPDEEVAELEPVSAEEALAELMEVLA